MDRRRELAGKGTLPARSTGAALFADISGFTNLTEVLSRTLGAKRGAEELSRLLNQVFGPITNAIHATVAVSSHSAVTRSPAGSTATTVAGQPRRRWTCVHSSRRSANRKPTDQPVTSTSKWRSYRVPPDGFGSVAPSTPTWTCWLERWSKGCHPRPSCCNEARSRLVGRWPKPSEQGRASHGHHRRARPAPRRCARHRPGPGHRDRRVRNRRGSRPAVAPARGPRTDPTGAPRSDGRTARGGCAFSSDSRASTMSTTRTQEKHSTPASPGLRTSSPSTKEWSCKPSSTTRELISMPCSARRFLMKTRPGERWSLHWR